MTKALLYARVSSEEQVKFGYSIDAQIDNLTKYCKENNLYIKGIYKDEGISGATISKRKSLQRMIHDANDGDIIIFTKIDRFSRNLLDANNIVKELEKKNVSIKAIYEDDIDTSTADGRFIFNLKLSLSQREREKTSERIREVFAYKKRIGEVVSGSIPYGFMTQNKRIVVDNDTMPIVIAIFNKYLENGSIKATNRYFRENGIITRSDKMISLMLRDERYKEYVTPKVFYQVQNELKRHGVEHKATGNVYLFSRLIVCPVCGRKLYGHTSKNQKNLIYYRCSSRSYGDKCDYHYAREEKIEEQLISKVPIFARQEKVRFEKDNDIDKIQSDINKVNKKIERLRDLYIDGSIDKNAFSSRFEPLNEQVAQLNLQLEKSQQIAVNEILEYDFKGLYESLDKEHKRRFWNRFIHEIIINDAGEIVSIHFT